MSDARWATALRAARCLHVDAGLGGLHIRARAGAVRDAVLRVCPQGARLHPDMAHEALFGGLDLTETLRTGQAVTRQGLIDRHATLTLTMAERTTPALAAMLGQVLDAGGHTLVALDEGVEDEVLPPSLTERLGMWVALDGLRLADCPDDITFDAGDPVDDPLAQLVALAARLGISSLRRAILAARVARASARLDGRDQVATGDIAFAVTTALAPHATQLPEPEEAEAAPEDPAAPSDPGEAPDDTAQTLPDEVVLEAAMAQLPADVLARIADGATPRATGQGAGARRTGNRRGRPLPSRPGRLDGRARIDLVATLRAAAPWQRLRGGGPGARVQVRGGDLRLRRYETRSDRLLIFAVDASGSSAFARLAEAKGAVELLLAQAYSKRDHVALLSFRGTGADLLLTPTRSLARAKKHLAGLPGGGGTPLAAGLRDGLELARHARGRGLDPALVVLTDGRPNIALSGEAARPEAARDADIVAGLVRAAGLPGLVIDTGARPSGDLGKLAARMGVRYLPLPRTDAAGLGRAVADAL